eukprot:4614067-Amphidinium_carterae.2
MLGAPLLPASPGRRGGRVRTNLPLSTAVRRGYQAGPTDSLCLRAGRSGDFATRPQGRGGRARRVPGRPLRTCPPGFPA